MKRRIGRFAQAMAGLFLALSAATTNASAATTCKPSAQRAIVLQPWASHAALDDAGWARLGREARRRGYSHVLLQWARYGDYEFWPDARSRWLGPGLRQWDALGLKLILGLHMGQDYFQVLDQPDAVLVAHLADTRGKALMQARQILHARPGSGLAGWYLPQEIDDLHWRSPARQRLLDGHLAGLQRSLSRLTPHAPIYASAFFSGASTPDEFARLLARLHRDTGVIWIVQDGLGTGRLSAERTRSYLDAIAATLPASAWRGLLEGFDQHQAEGRVVIEPTTDIAIGQRAALWCAATGRQAEMMFSMNQLMADILPAP